MWTITRLIFTLFSLLLLCPAASANVGPPARGGQIVAEPTGLEDVAITRETLTIDLRPLAANGLAVVEATYHLDNRGPQRTLDLLFVSGSQQLTDFKLWLGDQIVPSTVAAESKLPASWRPPKQTPGIHTDQGIAYLSHNRREVKPIAFSIVLPSGAQTLKVRYEAEAAVQFYGQPTLYRQFAYILAPAKEWASFGGLDVAIHLPDSWHAACTPELKREGDVLRGNFANLPADAIALTVQAPAGFGYDWLVHGSRALLVIIGLAGAIVCAWAGWSRGRRQHSALLLAFGLALAWGGAVFASGYFAIEGPSLALPEFQETTYGYGKALAFIGVILLSVAALPVGFTICLIAAAIAAGMRRPPDASAEPPRP